MNNENNQVNWEKFNFFIDFFTLTVIVYSAFLSFFCPIIGILLGIVFLSSKKTVKIKKIGQLYLILGIVGLIIGIIFIGIFLGTYRSLFWKGFNY